jgi:transcriptional regulator with XRE-family HTH domain
MRSLPHQIGEREFAVNHDRWASSLTTRVARAMRDARKAAGLTMADVARACADRGAPDLSEQSVKNLESGRKATLALADFLVLADVLGVPPVGLLFPLGSAETVEVLPGRKVPTWDALAWFTGEDRAEGAAAEGSAREVLDLFRTHGDLVTAASTSTSLARERRRAASTTLDRERRAALLERAQGYEEIAFEDCRDLGAFRARMRERGLVPPALPEELTFVADAGAEARE